MTDKKDKLNDETTGHPKFPCACTCHDIIKYKNGVWTCTLCGFELYNQDDLAPATNDLSDEAWNEIHAEERSREDKRLDETCQRVLDMAGELDRLRATITTVRAFCKARKINHLPLRITPWEMAGEILDILDGKKVAGDKPPVHDPAPNVGEQIIKWHPYPQEIPEQDQTNLIIKTRNERIINGLCFYHPDDAAHDHSPWRRAVGWISLKELGNGKLEFAFTEVEDES